MVVIFMHQVALGEPGKQRFFPFHSGSREAWKEAMMKQFPDEEKALDKYLFYLKVIIRGPTLREFTKRLHYITITEGDIPYMYVYKKYNTKTH